MKFLVAILAVILTVTPAVAQNSGSDAAATGIAGLIGMFGIFGFLVALVYSVLLFLLPFLVWGCLGRLTNIRDEISRAKTRTGRCVKMDINGTGNRTADSSTDTGSGTAKMDVARLERHQTHHAGPEVKDMKLLITLAAGWSFSACLAETYAPDLDLSSARLPRL
jgi:hypothetical protein